MAESELQAALNRLLDTAVCDLLAAREAALHRPTAVEWTTGYCKGVAAAIGLVRNLARDDVFDIAVHEAVVAS